MSNDTPSPPGTENELTGPGFYVVGIGASAGGLAALRTLFGHMPAEPGVAFVVIVHLSPEHESHLVELLQPYTKMPVCQVKETVPLQANHVYVIPPNANLNTIDTHLRLSQLEARRIERAPIDHFLRTLAATHDDCAVGVILTGAGSDGSLGLGQIKKNGGLTVAQDPTEAEFDGMPRSAIATGMVDLVVPLREIATEILRFCATRPQLPVPDGEDSIGTTESEVLERIMVELRTRTGKDFALFRRATILRRMRTRMQLRHSQTLSTYLEALRAAPDEAKALCRDLLFTVTEFFADPQVFDHLAREVLPALFARKRNRGDRLRIWSVGCSTGEEAYSLAMLLLERAASCKPCPMLQLFASDPSEQVLQTAREGVYPQEVGASLSAKRLEDFFIREGEHYRVRREVRGVVVFAAHDLFKDPPYAHLDLIVCRNLLCKLQPVVRRGVLNLFYYALEPHGILIVGREDEIHEPDLFVRDEHVAGMYRRTVGREPALTLPPVMGREPFVRRDDQSTRVAAPIPGARYAAAIFQLAMERYTPASVLIDGENHVIHYSAGAGRYIRLPGGELTHDLLQLVREPIHSRLAPVLDGVRRERIPWRSAAFPVAIEGGSRRIALQVEPLPLAESPGWLLVVFDEKAAFAEDARQGEQGTVGGAVGRLQAELDVTHQRLRAMIRTQAESDIAQAANAATQVANEELRMIVEELQSSREELQAVNEELITLDHENRQRLGQLTQITADLSHLLESTGIATLFIDLELKIVRFTPQLAGIFNVRLTDIGRPLADLTNELHYADLEADARRVLAHLSPVDREVAGAPNRWYLSRMLPYRTAAQRVDGVVLTLIDITERKRAENRLREADRRKDEFLAMLAHELRNPLAPISSGIEILRRASGEQQTVDRVSAMMARQAQQLIRLVDDLLEVSRISGGKLRLHKQPVPLKSIIHDAITAARPLLDSLTHDLTVTEPPQAVVVDADAVRLTQVIANLLNNAARYTPRGGKIEVIVEPQEGSVTVTVKDNGVGIEAEAIGHVFDMFYQGGARVLPAAGLGIGLALAKSLVELHGGTITVVSRGSQYGSEFKVRLPTTTAVPSSDVAAIDGQESRIGGDRRVLIVDDNGDAAESLCTLIKTLGDTDVHTAANGKEALQRAAELHPEIILLDLLMPDMDGFEVARRIRREPWGKGVTIVALTGWGLDEHRRRSKEAGFDAHLTKPVDMAALRSVLGAPRAPEKRLA